MHPFSSHSTFFSSLDNLQHRLASEQRQSNPNSPPSQSDALTSPLFITTNPTPLPDDSSAPPSDFLFPQPKPTQENDFETLMSLLGIDDHDDDGDDNGDCGCSGGVFYGKIAGVKGPKCEKERKRLDGWIAYYRGAKREPARLAHLLLARAAASGDGLEAELEFPVTVEQFLSCDPPLQ